MIRRRTLMTFAGAALGLGLGPACKRREMPKVELLDEDGTPPETEAIGALAPPWPPAERVVLSNDLLVHWLTEEGSPALHVRMLLPTHGLEDEVAPGAAAVVAEALALELRRWTQRYGTTVELAPRVDRYEVAIHGRDSKTESIVAGIGRVVAVAEPEGLLLRAREAVAAGLPALSADIMALTTLVGILDERDPERERLTKESVEGLEIEALLDAWRALLDPKRVMLVVHAGRPVETSERAMTRLAKAWTRGGILSGIGKANEKAIDRLRPQAARGRGKDEPSSAVSDRLRGSPQAPMHLLELAAGVRGGSVLALGRRLPLVTVEDRACARLAQRLLQEEVDARLTIVGDRGLFVVMVPIRKSRPPTDDDGAKGKSVAKDKRGRDKDKDKDKDTPKDPRAAYVMDVLDETREFIRTRAPRLRLAQAAELWLGARMVQASLTGEDWTALWSESIDLSRTDGGIGGGLARDAQAMLKITPETLVEYARKWLDFDHGEPGWAWVAAGNEPDLGKALGQIAKIKPVIAG